MEELREELIIKYRPMVYWLVQKLHVPQTLYNEAIEAGMSALFTAIERGNFTQESLYNKIRVAILAKLPDPEDEITSTENFTIKDWSLDLEDNLEQLLISKEIDLGPKGLVPRGLFSWIKAMWKGAFAERE